jgi:hypothetical protein
MLCSLTHAPTSTPGAARPTTEQPHQGPRALLSLLYTELFLTGSSAIVVQNPACASASLRTSLPPPDYVSAALYAL